MTTRPKGRFARFAFHSNEIKNEREAKPPLFQPNKCLELSVSDVCGLDCAGIVNEGIKVGNRRNDVRLLYGWAELDREIIRRANLRLHYDNVPKRHANIVGWPKERGARKKQQQFLIDELLACPVKLNPPVQI